MSNTIEQITRERAAASRRPHLRDAPCIVGLAGQWWVSSWVATDDRKGATCISVSKAISMQRYITDDAVLHILDYPQPPNDGQLWLNKLQWGSLQCTDIKNTLRCKVRHLNGQWKMSDGVEVSDMRLAQSFVVEAAGARMKDTDLLLIPGISPDQEAVATAPLAEGEKRKICDVSAVLSYPVMQLLKTNPTNPEVRSMVRAAARKKIPDEHITTEAIIEWIEYNIQPMTPPPKGKVTPGLDAPQAPHTSGLTVRVDCSDVERGTCSYSDARSAQHMATIDQEWILDRALDHNFETLVNDVLSAANQQAADANDEGNIGMRSVEEIEYENYDMTESQDFQTQINHTQAQRLREELSVFLRSRLTAEEIERMGVPTQAPF